jgi:hypothetical protein
VVVALQETMEGDELHCMPEEDELPELLVEFLSAAVEEKISCMQGSWLRINCFQMQRCW